MRRFPAYRPHRSGQARVTLNGIDHYLGPHGSAESWQAYYRLKAAWEQGAMVASKDHGSNISIAELVLAYHRHARAYYRKNGRQTSQVSHVDLSTRRLVDIYGELPAAHFGPQKLVAVREQMLLGVCTVCKGSGKLKARFDRWRRMKRPERPCGRCRGSGKRAWSRGYVNKCIKQIKHIWKWGVSQELVPQETYQALLTVEGLKRGRCQAPERPKVKPAPIASIRAAIRAAGGPVAAMMKLQFLTGMRACEVTAIRPAEVDHSGKVWLYTVQEEANKTEHLGRARTVHLGPRAQRVLTPFMLRGGHEFCFKPADAPNVKRKRLNDRYTTDSYCQAIGYACAAAKVERFTPLQLRHTAATRIRRKYGIEVARILLGHSTAFTTEIYAEADVQKARKVMLKMG